MKKSIGKTIAGALFISSLAVFTGISSTAYAEVGPVKGTETDAAVPASNGPTVPSAQTETTSVSTETPSPFDTNIYGTPVNGYYCDAVTTYTYEDLQSDITMLTTQFSGMVSGSSLGVTADGRNIFELIVGNAYAENQILLVGTMHGREYITTQLIMRQIHSLLSMAKSGESISGTPVSELLNTTCIRVIPMNNPDGAALSQFGEKAVNNSENIANLRAMINHDKEREGYTGDTDWYYRRWKNNINGVDINRNFTPGWTELDDSRHYPSYEYYKGASAESEAETRALINVLNEAQIDEVINYHAQGGVIYWSFGGATEPVESRCKELAELIKQDTGYILGSASTNKASKGAGAYKEYLAGKGIPAVTIEVGLGSCPLPDTDITGIWEKNQNVLNDLIFEINKR
ncbi:M14 family zinc carboxypeptidase [Oribacterium sp. WCC10]|uniref:M14 family zinc carboxypeptidase n=1 Tax=Oribacterium sp. WCC10 TaxID=1855343 RepID=UPI0008E87775|nr:M14 family zinc carboxypeptidase [Oribacterium sp. WCC10]SFG23830.1 g-D-glutamyl-meso-diaminopimelate peptidase [Oribacterium sp. WCC10]